MRKVSRCHVLTASQVFFLRPTPHMHNTCAALPGTNSAGQGSTHMKDGGNSRTCGPKLLKPLKFRLLEINLGTSSPLRMRNLQTITPKFYQNFSLTFWPSFVSREAKQSPTHHGRLQPLGPTLQLPDGCGDTCIYNLVMANMQNTL